MTRSDPWFALGRLRGGCRGWPPGRGPPVRFGPDAVADPQGHSRSGASSGSRHPAEHPRRLAETPRPPARQRPLRRSRMGRSTGHRRRGTAARQVGTRQRGDLRRLLWLVERRPVPSRQDPIAAFHELLRRLHRAEAQLFARCRPRHPAAYRRRPSPVARPHVLGFDRGLDRAVHRLRWRRHAQCPGRAGRHGHAFGRDVAARARQPQHRTRQRDAIAQRYAGLHSMPTGGPCARTPMSP